MTRNYDNLKKLAHTKQALVSLWSDKIHLVAFVCVFFLSANAYAFETEASYYTVASCRAEGTSGICASGERLDDEALTCASWDFKFGTRLKVKCNGREVVVKVNDRGPAKRLYKRGRRIDLSFRAARVLGIVKIGICKVEVTKVGG